MKIYKLLLILLLFATTTNAQKKEFKDTLLYQIDKDLLYRDVKAEKLDDYAIKNCQLDIYYPSYKKSFPTIVWFHGGSLTGGKKEIPDELLKKGYAVVGVEYRKNPIVKCPVYIEDAAAAVAWVFKNIERYGGNVNKIYLSGHSAGGYLDLMVGMDKKWLAAYGIDASKIAGLLPLSPQVITHFKIRSERGIPDTQAVIDEFAPIYHVRKDLPPIVIITGDRELEMLGRYEENAYFVRMMKLVGHEQAKLFELDGFGHGSMKQPGLILLVSELNKLLK
jgi:acetyl esterase/lipase